MALMAMEFANKTIIIMSFVKRTIANNVEKNLMAQ